MVLAEGCRRTCEPSPDPFEKLDVSLWPLDQVPEMIKGGEIRHALVIAAFALMSSC